MINSSLSTSSTKPILVICDLQPDLLGSLNNASKQDLLEALSIVIEAARDHQWKIVYSSLQFTSGYQKVPENHKLYGAFAKLHKKLGDKAVHWFLEGWEGSQVLKEPDRVAPRPSLDKVVTREQHLPHELIQSLRLMTNGGVGDALNNSSATPLINTSQKVYLAGAKASGSVQITAQMLMDQGFSVCCIDEAIQDDNAEKRQAIIHHVLPIYGSVMSLQEFVEQMGGLESFSKDSQRVFVEFHKRQRIIQAATTMNAPQPPTTKVVAQESVVVPKTQNGDSKSAAATADKKKKQTYLLCNCGRRGHGAKYTELLLQRNSANYHWQTFPSQIWYEDLVHGDIYHCPLGKQIVEFCDEPEFSKVSMYLLGREWLDEKDKFLEIANVDNESEGKSYMPQTYCLEKGKWRIELAPPQDGQEGPWFVKEANKNLGGAAINIVAKTSEIAAHLLFPNDRRYVVQAHIRDPLLTDDGRKTHIKFYVLLVGAEDGITWTLYTYKPSLLSISPNKWSTTDLSHDTQVTIHRHPEPPGETEGWKQHWDEVYQKCKQGTAHIIQRAIAMGKLKGRKRPKSKIGNHPTHKDEEKSLFQKQFEVFSVDWMPDTHGNVWVLECNLSPAIAQPEFQDPSHRDARRDYLMKHDEAMLKEALEIVLPSSGGEPLDYGQWDFAGTFHSDQNDEKP